MSALSTKQSIGRLLLLICIGFLPFRGLVGQNYQLSPGDSIVINGGLEDLETLSILQNNLTADTIHLKWLKISASVPDKWEASICDNKICYTTLLDSGDMSPVLVGEYGFVLLHITSHTNFGTAIIRYAVWEEKNGTASKRDTLTFILHVLNPLQNTKVSFDANVKVYPNPAMDYIAISNSETGDNIQLVRLINNAGATVKQAVPTTSDETLIMAIEDLPPGFYTISIQTKNSNKTIKLIKNSKQ